jgi:hypothetical protein
VADLLAQCHTTAGVIGSFVFDNYGMRLGAYVDEGIGAEETHRVGLNLAQMLAALETLKFTAKEMQINFSRHSLYVRALGNAFGVILCNQNVNWSLLRMTVNVAAKPFETDRDLQRNLQLSSPSVKETLTPSLLKDEELQLIRRMLWSDRRA